MTDLATYTGIAEEWDRLKREKTEMEVELRGEIRRLERERDNLLEDMHNCPQTIFIQCPYCGRYKTQGFVCPYDHGVQ
jgi:hypothetical protein